MSEKGMGPRLVSEGLRGLAPCLLVTADSSPGLSPLQSSCRDWLRPLDRGTWRATVHEITKSWT